jgi:pilus assembly protein CpaB
MISKRTQMNPRNVTLLLAAILALGTGVLLFNYLSGVNSAATKVAAKRAVLIAVRAIPAQTAITRDMVDQAVRPADSVEPDAIDPSQMQSLLSSVALVAIPAGGTLTQSRVARPSALGLAAKVKPGMRAVTIPIDRVKGVAGLVDVGDRVDVIAILPARPDGIPAARAILRGTLVLAIGMAMVPLTNSAAPLDGSTSTMEVTPEQANLLAVADVNTTLRLALRSPAEPARSLPVELMSLSVNAPAGPARAPAVPARAATPAMPVVPPSARPQPKGPEIIDGDKIVGVAR